MMPRLDGYEVCRQLKANPLTSRIPIIFLTAKSTFEDKIHGLELFADDYLTKPWAQNELLFRVRNQLKTRRGQLQSNALTGLPGNVLIESELSRRIAQGEKFAYLHIDLDYFKAYNDYYGHARGDVVIRYVAAMLQAQLQKDGQPGDFVGHIGGDDFVVITTPERSILLGDAIRSSFDATIASQYDEQDLQRVHIMVLSSRQGGVQKFELMTVTIPVVSTVGRAVHQLARADSFTLLLLEYETGELQGDHFERGVTGSRGSCRVTPRPGSFLSHILRRETLIVEDSSTLDETDWKELRQDGNPPEAL